ncbi:MAG: alcohol dehydrogenase catalytic domain-containing protein, partial [Actinomycetes bacterium]
MSTITVPALLLDVPGEPSSLRVGQIECPDPAPGQVRLSVQACGVNPVDLALCRAGDSHWHWPHVLGLDVVGTVDAIGEGVASTWSATRVAVHHDLRGPGGLAGAVCVDATMIARVPDRLTAAQAATVPCPGLTAVQVVARAGIGSGSRVLVTGAGGAVGTFVCQLAIGAGAQVDAVAAPVDLERLLGFGVGRVVDYHAAEVASTLRR